MRVSQYYDLMQDQATLDFVDVDLETDVAVFIDPRAIRVQKGALHDGCINLLVTFFKEILEGLHRGDKMNVLDLLGHLDEPNETHLGVSKGRPRGKGLGGIGANRIVDSLLESRAAKSRLLEDLEDSALFIKGIGRDIISDITTNVIRSALIEYTQNVCEYYEIPTEEQYAGWVWNEDTLSWEPAYAELPRVESGKLLLVPKSIVRAWLTLSPDRYYRAGIAPFHEEIELKAGSSLVYALKSGEKRVNRDKLIKKYGNSKSAVIKHTENYPQAFRNFKSDLEAASTPPLSHDTLASKTRSQKPHFDELLDRIRSILPGQGGAPFYHQAIGDLLSAVFYPHLGNMKPEKPIHDGRKRIDLSFDNLADSGFFRYISRHYSAAQIAVECKNYTSDPKNPELDQVSGRFSKDRTHVGIIVCRQIKNKKLFAARCRDTKKDGRGFVLFLDDEDLEQLVIESYDTKGEFPLLRQQYDYLVG